MKKNKDLTDHIMATYKILRIGAAFIAIAFPWILYFGGRILADLPLQGSMSAYYHAGETLLPGQGVMRNWFVGILFAIGVILILYKGISDFENYTLDIAGFLAISVAVCPMTWPIDPAAENEFFSLHGFFAISFFICIAIVSITCASDTLGLVKNRALRKFFRLAYICIGSVMVALPFLSAFLKYFSPLREVTIFLVETLGIYAFATYWGLKSIEITNTGFDRDAALGKIWIEPRTLLERIRLQPMSVTLLDDRNLPQKGQKDLLS